MCFLLNMNSNEIIELNRYAGYFRKIPYFSFLHRT